MSGKTVTAQARPDPMPVPGQRPGPPFFAILIVAGLIVIGAGLRSTANIVGPLFLVITLVITVAPLRNLLVRRHWPSWLASAVSLLTIYALLVLAQRINVSSYTRMRFSELPTLWFQRVSSRLPDLARPRLIR
jgi:predicted PurR-regulated permease PerM